MIGAAIRAIPLAVMLTLTGAMPASAQDVSEQEAYAIAKDGYVYAYP